MLLKFLWGYDLLFYCLYKITVKLLSFAFIRLRHRRVFTMCAYVSVIINSESNKVTVNPDKNTRVISDIQTSEYNLEFNLSTEQIQEINENFGTEMVNNVITGDSAVTIIETYLDPLMKSSEMHEVIQEILDHF